MLTNKKWTVLGETIRVVAAEVIGLEKREKKWIHITKIMKNYYKGESQQEWKLYKGKPEAAYNSMKQKEQSYKRDKMKEEQNWERNNRIVVINEGEEG